MILVAPSLYMSYFSKIELKWCFIYSQFIYIFGATVYWLQALRLNLEVGIPDVVVYVFSHLFDDTMEKILLFYPSTIFVAQIAAPGVEAFMSSIGGTIIQFNMFTLRSIIGLYCNKWFADITRDTIEDYYKLAFIQIIGCVIPLLYMYHIIPSNAEVEATQKMYQEKIVESQKKVGKEIELTFSTEEDKEKDVAN